MDLIERQAAIDALKGHFNDEERTDTEYGAYWHHRHVLKVLECLPSAEPEYFDYSDIDEAWEYYAKEHDANLTDNAKQLKDAMWVGYRIGKKSAQPERKKGKWIEDAETYYKAVNEHGGGVNEDTPYFTDDIACPECLALFSVDDNCTEEFNFCPNCGADMRGE